MGGTNDVSVYGVKKGLSELRERLDDNRRVVIVGVPPRHDDPDGFPNVKEIISRKNEFLRDFCDFYGWTFLSTDDSEKHFYTRHGLHYNVTGKRWLAKKIQTAVNFL